MKTGVAHRILRASAWCALASLTLIVWATFDSHPLVLVLAMSVGQVLGTASLAGFLYVVVADLRRAHVFDEQVQPLSGPPSDPPPRAGAG